MARALWLPDVLSAAGLHVVTHPGWETRGKEMEAVEGVFAHHTASPPNSTLATNLSVVTNGTNGTPGPIAQVLFWRNGDAHVVASGKANHGGAGGPWGWLPYSPPGQLSIANARTIGFECVNSGVGEPWSLELVEALLTGMAAVLGHVGAPVDHGVMHVEWAPARKIDPAGPNPLVRLRPRSQTWDGDHFRELIAARMGGGARLASIPPPVTHSPHPVVPVHIPAPTGDDDMPPIRVRFHGYKNVFLLTGGGYIHLTGALNEHYANTPLVVSEFHEQGVKSALAQTGLTMADLDPSGE
jgi:hypothetical protein